MFSTFVTVFSVGVVRTYLQREMRSSKVEVFYVFSMYFKAVLLFFVEMIGKIEEINFAIRLHLKRYCVIFVSIFSPRSGFFGAELGYDV